MNIDSVTAAMYQDAGDQHVVSCSTLTSTSQDDIVHNTPMVKGRF
jgi:gluconate kinase